jgi:hypothetical protein
VLAHYRWKLFQRSESSYSASPLQGRAKTLDSFSASSDADEARWGTGVFIFNPGVEKKMPILRISALAGSFALMLWSVDGSAHAPKSENGMQFVAVRDAQVASAGSMCRPDDVVLFSCPTKNKQKDISMCASKGPTQDGRRYYYAYGRSADVPEMTYPSPHDATAPAQLFTRTFLTYAGGTGGYAYSFSRQGYKYIVYSISGTDINKAGVEVQKLDNGKIVADIKCQPGKVVDAADENLIRETLKWPVDTDIDGHGVP